LFFRRSVIIISFVIPDAAQAAIRNPKNTRRMALDSGFALSRAPE